MEITENWLRGIGGWKAFKEGRGLQGGAGVISATWDGKILHGEVRSGGKALRCGLKVDHESDVGNLCSCPQSRREGQICHHSIAVGLEWLARQAGGAELGTLGAKSVESGSGEEVGMAMRPKLSLMADLRKTWKKSILCIRLQWVAIDHELVDQGSFAAFGRWIRDQGLELGREVVLNLRGDQVGGFLGVVAEDEMSMEGFGGAGMVRVSGVPYRLRGRMSVGEGEGVCVHCDPPPGEMLRTKNENWLWLEDAGELRVVAGPPADWSVIEREVWGGLLAGGGEREVSLRWFLENREAMVGLVEFAGGGVIEGLEWGEEEPEVWLEFDGSAGHLMASLSFRYGEERCEIEISSERRDTVVAYVRSEGGVRVVQLRDGVRERRVFEELLSQGFSPSSKIKNKLVINGENAVFTYLAEELPGLPVGWKIELSPRLRELLAGLSQVRIGLSPVGSGEDWLGAEVQFEIGGEGVLSRREVLGLLRTGRRHFRLPGGGQALINLRVLADMEEALRDIEPRQEGGRFRFDEAQLPYLRSVLGQKSEIVEIKESLRINRLQAELRDYQKKGVGWLCRQVGAGMGALLADDMGLGKTLQTIACVEHLMSEAEDGGRVLGPVLVVCPTSLLENWRLELGRFVPHRKVLVYHGAGRRKYVDVLADADVVLTSYQLLHRDLVAHSERQYGGVVLDEASLVRNPDSQMAKAVHALRAPVRIALTGTPVENSVRDLWSVFQFVQPGYLGRKAVFRERYELPMGMNPPDAAAARRLRLRVAPFLLRRMKQEVAKELPDKIESTEWCVMGKAQSGVYEGLLREARDQVSEIGGKQGAGAARMSILTSLLRLRQACCDLSLLPGWRSEEGELEKSSAKRARLLELLREAVAGGHRVLVFSQFVSLLERVRGDISAEGWDYCWLTGSSRDRGDQVARFQGGEVPVFLISLKAGGYGLNLTAADTVIHLDPWWNPAVEDQATDRAHRIGQKRAVTAYKLIAKGTVEEKILRLQEKKRAAMASAMNESAPLMQGLSDAEIRELLA